MLSVGRAASAVPSHAASACSRCISSRPCQCSARSLKSRAKATMEEALSCLDTLIDSKPAIPAVRPATERRPVFHLAPASGWINDPNGPLLHNGTYHLFYQHVPDSSEWQWGLVWGHAKSTDLVHWEHLPVALEPTPNSLDQHGCFSGCATVDVDGTPALLYTGVIRKTPAEIEAGMSHQHEAQLIAVATDLDDPDLKHWQKLPGSFLPHPPAEMDLTGWRDPFVLEKPTTTNPWWYVMIGAGVRNKCGTALVYRSKDLTEGWQYVGPLCESPASSMWECPIMAHLTNTPPSSRASSSPQRQRHMLSVSPDYCVNMIQYWLGDYRGGRFDLQSADGPFVLDLGDIMYAPNILTDKQGRTVLWAWMQEKAHLRPSGAYSSACCLCVPRALYLSPDGKTLMQEPLPELRQLRQQQGAWHIGGSDAESASSVNSSRGSDAVSATSANSSSRWRDSRGVALLPRRPLHLGGGVAGFNSSSVDLELQVAKGDADSFVLVMHPFEGVKGAAGAAVAYCWSTNTLQVVYSTDLSTLEHIAALPLGCRAYRKQGGPDPVELAAIEAAAAEPGTPMRCGGALRTQAPNGAGADVIPLRILLDGSCLEVFTSTGETLGTRVYRGDDWAVQTHHQNAAQAGTCEAPGSNSPTAAAMAAAASAGAIGWEELFAIGSNAVLNGSNAAAASSGGQLELVSFGPGPASLISASAWQMSSMWQKQQVVEASVVAVPVGAAVTAAATEVLQGLVVAEAAAAIVAPVVLPVGELSLGMAAIAAGGSAAELLPLSPSGTGGVLPVQVEAS